MALSIEHYANSDARIADEADIAAGRVAQDDDTGNRYERTTSGWNPVRVGGAALVADLESGVWVGQATYTLSATASDITFSNPAKAIRIIIRPGGTTTADVGLVFCEDPPNDAYRDTTLTMTGAGIRHVVKQGEPQTFIFPSNVAEIGIKALGTTLGGAVADIEVLVP